MVEQQVLPLQQQQKADTNILSSIDHKKAPESGAFLFYKSIVKFHRLREQAPDLSLL
jgi:hypothetical protein